MHMQKIIQLQIPCPSLLCQQVPDPWLPLLIFIQATSKPEGVGPALLCHRGLYELRASRPGQHSKLAAKARVSWPKLMTVLALHMINGHTTDCHLQC